MEREYAWKRGGSKIKAADAFAELHRVATEQPGGVASPADIVEASRPKGALLHPEFEWRNMVAAQEWRKQQARQLANNIVVVDGEGDSAPRAPALVNVIVASGERGYMPTEAVLRDVELVSQVEAEAIAALEGFKRRFGALSRFARVVRAIEEALGSLGEQECADAGIGPGYRPPDAGAEPEHPATP